MIVHIMDQPELQAGEGPIAVIVAPTRELAEQIHKEAKRFAKPYGIAVVPAFGGLSKYEQSKMLKQGAEVCHHCRLFLGLLMMQHTQCAPWAGCCLHAWASHRPLALQNMHYAPRDILGV